MGYITAESDLDVLMYVGSEVDVLRLLAGMARIETRAPMRVDGELVREDGAAVNWRELRGEAREVLLKSVGGIDLVHPRSFLSRCLSS
jgi:phosphoribosyl-dephospho-CoA transferase